MTKSYFIHDLFTFRWWVKDEAFYPRAYVCRQVGHYEDIFYDGIYYCGRCGKPLINDEW